MKSIKGLIIKDLLNLNHYKLTLVATLVIFSIISVSQKNLSGFLPAVIVMMVGMIALSTFSYDEIAKSDKFILTLPTNRKEIVMAKYVLIISLTVISAVLAFIINVIISYFIFKQTPDLTSYMFTSIGGIFGIALIESIQIPSIYKWGVERGKIQMFVIIALIMAIFGGIVLLTKSMNINLDLNELDKMLTLFGLPLLILATIVMYFVSYKISNKIYIKKEI